MDRVTVYYGQLPRETDILLTNQNAMVALAKLSEAIFGTSTVVTGLALAATATPSMSLIVGPGQVYELEDLEGSPLSSLQFDSHNILKQGIQLDAATLTFAAPTTTGYAQVFLIQAQYEDADEGVLVLPYYNASNPASPFAGPGNAGSSQSTVRRGKVALEIKAGSASTSGTQVAPTPDAGWVGLYLVTVTQGQTSINAGNYSTYSAAPFLPVTLPMVPTGVQSQAWSSADDTGSTNALALSVNPPIQVYQKYQEFAVKIAHTNTGPTTVNVSGVGPTTLYAADGVTPLSGGELRANSVTKVIHNGTAFQLLGSPPTSAGTPQWRWNRALVPSGGIAASAIADHTTYVMDLAVCQTFALPAASAVSVGFVVRLETRNLPAGFQTAQVNTADADAIYFRSESNIPFYLIGNGEAFEFTSDGTKWIAYTMQEPASGLTATAAGDSSITTVISYTTPAWGFLPHFGFGVLYHYLYTTISSGITYFTVPVSGVYLIESVFWTVGHPSGNAYAIFGIFKVDPTVVTIVEANAHFWRRFWLPLSLELEQREARTVYLPQGTKVYSGVYGGNYLQFIPAKSFFRATLISR